MKALLLLAAAASLAVASGPAVFYSKHFPGSTPAFVSITLQKDGSAVYREAEDDEDPVNFKVSPEDTEQVFGLAGKLDHFKRPLESGLNVAKMGEKTFRYENGAERHEAKFNYSLDLDAKALLDLFERMTETQQLLFTLERTAKFDKLGVNKSILQVEAAYDRKRLIGPERFLPLLDRVAKNESYLHMARERAAALADLFRNPKPKTTPE